MIYFIVESSDYYMNGQENGNNNNLNNNVQFSMSDSPFGQFQNNSVDNNVNQSQPVVSTEPQVQNFNFSLNDSPFGQMIAENNEVVNQPTNMVNQTQAPEQSQPVVEDNSSKFFNPNVIENSSSGIGQTLYPDPVQNNINGSVNVVNQTTNVQNNNVVAPNLNKSKKTVFDYLRSVLYVVACLALLIVGGLFLLRFTCVKTLSCSTPDGEFEGGTMSLDYVVETIFDKIYHQKLILTVDFSKYSDSERDKKIQEYIDEYDTSETLNFAGDQYDFKTYKKDIERQGNSVIVTVDEYVTLSGYFKDDEKTDLEDAKSGMSLFGFVCAD